MNMLELLIIAVGLAMDAFAVSICVGLPMQKATFRKSAIAGLYFGVFQAGMPIAGYLAGRRFTETIRAYDHWIAFGLLAFIGGRMMLASFKKTDCPENPPEEPSLGLKKMLPLAVATSIDALAVGVSFAFLDVHILSAALSIGTVTFLLSAAGVKIGQVFGLRFKSKAERTGGIVLVLMGLKILIDHLFFNG